MIGRIEDFLRAMGLKELNIQVVKKGFKATDSAEMLPHSVPEVTLVEQPAGIACRRVGPKTGRDE